MRKHAGGETPSRIATRARDCRAKRMFARGLSHEDIAQKMQQSVEWVRITLEDFSPKELADEIRKAKQKQKESVEKSGKRLGRPPKKTEQEQPASEETGVSVNDVLARFRRIRKMYEKKEYQSIKHAAECEGLEYKVVFRICRGFWPGD